MKKLFLALLVLPFALFAGLDNATLYYSPSCPHCKDVLQYMQSNNIKLQTKNIQNPVFQKEYSALGKSGVPALSVDGQVIVGSTAIISYLKSQESTQKR